MGLMDYRARAGGFALIFTSAFALSLATMAPAPAWAQVIPGRPNAEAGAELAQKVCSNCHLTGAAAGEGSSANVDVPSFKQIANMQGQTAEAISGAIALPAHPMPMIQLTREETGHLTEYILSLRESD